MFLVNSWLLKKYKLFRASKQIWCQTSIKIHTLTAISLDSIPNNDSENDISEEESNEEEFDYNDM